MYKRNFVYYYTLLLLSEMHAVFFKIRVLNNIEIYSFKIQTLFTKFIPLMEQPLLIRNLFTLMCAMITSDPLPSSVVGSN
jgi:hypothetical protein